MMMHMPSSLDFDDMHEEIDLFVESGDLNDLEKLRNKYNIPIMHWVESEEDLELAKQMYERFVDKEGYQGGCHGWK